MLLLNIPFIFGLSKEIGQRVFHSHWRSYRMVVQAMTALDAILKVREENWKEKIARLEEENAKLRKEIAKISEENTNIRSQLSEYKEQNK